MARTRTTWSALRATPEPGAPSIDGNGAGDSLGPSERARLLITGSIVVAAAALATCTNAIGWYIADARFEHYWAGEQFIARHQWLWDGVRGLGRPAPYFSPVVGSFLGLLQSVSASPIVVERIVHGTYLVVAGLGMVQVLRLFRPRIGPEHVIAALCFMFSPFTSQFLVPSGIFLHYAIAPWLLVAFVRGVRGPDRWRWAAVFALAVFSVGGLNVPALVYAGFPIVSALLYLTVLERSVSWRAVASWLGRAVILTALVSIPMLVYLRFNTSSFSENLGTTELPEAVNRHSSWSEVWRGLGYWLTYLRVPGGPLRPESTAFFTDLVVIAATFAVPLTAVATVWRSRWRPRLFFAAVVGVSLVLMVGLYPVDDAVPAGRLLDFGYDHSLLLRSFRNTYKAGSGLGIGLSALFAVGIVDGGRVLARRRHNSGARSRGVRPASIVLGATVLAVASFPFWTGNLYSRSDRVRDVPDYWYDALGWLDGRQGDGRVMVLPGTTRTRYRWGYVGDDIFDALLDRPHVVRQSLSQGTPPAANLLVATDAAAVGTEYQPGSIAPIARRLGIRWIVVRNDLAWQAMGSPRPSDLDGLRHDPDLVSVATFGRRGQHTSARGDGRADSLGETDLPPVEVYRVRGSGSPIQALGPAAPVLVSGDGDAWPRLAGDGALDHDGPLRYTAAMSARAIERAIVAGAPVVITDTNRRRVTQVTTNRNLTSHTLAPGEELQREAGDLFEREGSQSVATYADAIRITASRYGNPSAVDYETWLRPASAFDRYAETAWLVGGVQTPIGDWLRVDFKRPQRLRQVDLTPVASGGRSITAAELRFSDGSTVPVALRGPTTNARFQARSTEWLEVRITAIGGLGLGPVGFADVSLPGLDLEETITLPTDLARAAAGDSDLARTIDDASMTYSFERLAGGGAGVEDTELALRRRFETIGSREYELRGTISAGEGLVPSNVVPTGECTNALLELDTQPIAVRLTPPAPSTDAGSLSFEACGPVSVGEGVHQLSARPGAGDTVERVELSTAGASTVVPEADSATVRVVSRSPTRYRLRVDAPAGGYLVAGQSFSDDWHASIDGRELGSAQSLNTLTGWRLPAQSGPVEIEVSYGPQRLWEAALAISGAAVIVCLWLVVRRRRTPPAGTTR